MSEGRLSTRIVKVKSSSVEGENKFLLLHPSLRRKTTTLVLVMNKLLTNSGRKFAMTSGMGTLKVWITNIRI